MARRWLPGAAGIGRWLLLLALTLSVALVLGLPWGLVVMPGSARGVGQESVGTPTNPLPPSSEALASRSPWSRPESYPLTLRPRTPLYRPSAEWIGRLILPSPRETAAAPQEDWVWIEIEQAPAAR
ncbi:MAG: hypothetical protein VKI42_09175, partial [Synechococcaceae cyanobacterium]|nr:hypothetical protein [Synechococcaceae cyanobacterium]